MKKIHLFLLAVIGLFMFACNNDAPQEEEVVEETPVEEVEEVVTETEEVEASSVELPDFENEDLQEFAQAFDTYMDKAITLMKAGDMEGLEALNEEGEALQQKGEELKDNVSEEDKALLEEYLKEKAMEMVSASGLDKLGEKLQEEMSKE